MYPMDRHLNFLDVKESLKKLTEFEHSIDYKETWKPHKLILQKHFNRSLSESE